MSFDPQPNPVVFFPPALAPQERLNAMDFRPIARPIEPEVENEETDASDPKGLSAQESVSSSANEVVPPSTPSLPVPPATIAPAAKDNTKPKVNEPSTPTS